VNAPWVIVCIDGSTDETGDYLFWNNEDGWGSLSGATWFNTEDVSSLALPFEGAWIPYDQAYARPFLKA
jgi:hypothetical protein